MGPWVLALGARGLFEPALTLAGSVGTHHSQTPRQSQKGKTLIGSDKGLKYPSLNSGLQAGREPGTPRCMPWGARGGIRHLGDLRLGEHPRWGFGCFVNLEAPAAPGAPSVSFGAVGQGVNAEAGGRGVCGCLGASSCGTRAGHGSAEPRGCGSLTMPLVPGANSPLNVPCRGVPGSDTTAVVANCREQLNGAAGSV